MTTSNEQCTYFLSKTKPFGDGCMIWQGAIDDNGFPYAKVDGKKVLVHRFVALHYNKSEEQAARLMKHKCRQSCDITACINPIHLKFTDSKPEKKYVDLVNWWNPPQ